MEELISKCQNDIEIKKHELYGKYVVSKRKIELDETILVSERSHCYGFLPYLITQICITCFKEHPKTKKKNTTLPFSCEQCYQVYYCSEKCRDFAKSNPNQTHNQLECLVLGSMRIPTGFSFHQISEIRMIVNYISKVSCISSEQDHEMIQDMQNQVMSLVGDFGNSECFTKDDTKFIRKMASVVKKGFQPFECRIPEGLVEELFAKSQRNCFGIWKNCDECIGLAIYPSSSFFNHSCFPNCARVQSGPIIKIIPLIPIEQGEEINISYISVNVSTHERKEHLTSGYCFDCKCKRCLLPTTSQESIHIEKTITSYLCKNPSIECSGYLVLGDKNLKGRFCNFCKWVEK